MSAGSHGMQTGDQEDVFYPRAESAGTSTGKSAQNMRAHSRTPPVPSKGAEGGNKVLPLGDQVKEGFNTTMD